MTFNIEFYPLLSGHIFNKNYIVVMNVVSDVTYYRKSVNTRVVITLLLHDVIHWKTGTSYDKCKYCITKILLWYQILKASQFFQK